MAATRSFSLGTMEGVLLLLLFHLINLSVCIHVINYPFLNKAAALEKIERPIIKRSDEPSITSVNSLVVGPEYEQITYDTLASSDMLCCISANTGKICYFLTVIIPISLKSGDSFCSIFSL